MTTLPARLASAAVIFCTGCGPVHPVDLYLANDHEIAELSCGCGLPEAIWGSDAARWCVSSATARNDAACWKNIYERSSEVLLPIFECEVAAQDAYLACLHDLDGDCGERADACEAAWLERREACPPFPEETWWEFGQCCTAAVCV
jgi:hypothetical protein